MNAAPSHGPAPRPPRQPVPVHVVGQFSWGLTLLFVLASLCWWLLPFTGSMFSALVFLLAIVLAGTRWNRGPVLAMAAVAALVWNYFFIPPRFTLHIERPEDVVMFGMFFVVAMAMGHLITRLRAREAALEHYHQEREQLLQARHRAEIAAEAERLHRTLLDSVSHELKTPITIIRTALDGLDAANPFTAEIDTATRRLQRIVENLLEITRVESDAVKPAPDWCEIGDVLHAATAPLQRELAAHPLRVTGTDHLPLLRLDSRLLAQALANILHNAAQHAPAGTDIEIHVTPPSAGPGDGPNLLLHLRVRDHGPGLAPEMEDRVFDKFSRARGAPAGGTGLGLAISRGLMRAMKGDITVRNHPEGGAEFLLSLPVKTRQP
ncbi:MAG: Adaptive-response sensory-kinase SasA [Prosthecobacter sp.]|nr:Adaptive-response sensory-kinase SasA [Prosthecobacter sp.]